MKPLITVETITPDWAKKELQEQESRIAKGVYRNRKINDLTVKLYANDMKQGHWLVNNQGIGFDVAGNLLDGRHRLWAVVKSKRAVDMLVFRGLEARKNGSGLTVNPIDTIDCGRVRSIGAQMAIDGVPNANVTASVVRAIGFTAIYPSNRKFGTIPARGIMDVYREEFEKYGSHFSKKAQRQIRSAFMSPIIMYAKIKPRKAAQFYEDFTTLVELKEGSPAIALDAYARSHAGHAGTDEMKAGLCATALALYHHDNDSKVNTIRQSTIGIEWLQKEAAEQIKKIKKLIGEEEVE